MALNKQGKLPKSEYKILEKAFKVSHANQDDYIWGENDAFIEFVFADSHNQAKYHFSAEYGFPYQELRAVRYPDRDMVLYKGEQHPFGRLISSLKDEQAAENRKKTILSYPEGATFYVATDGYVGNMLIWHRKDHRGYSSNIDEAHQWSRAEALKEASSPNFEGSIWPKEKVDAVVTRHVDMQNLSFDIKIS